MNIQKTLEAEQDTGDLTLSPEERLLIWCVTSLSSASQADPSAWPPAIRLNWRKLALLAKWHRLLPLFSYLHERNSSFAQVPLSLLQQSKEDYNWSACHNALLQGHLRSILTSFRDHNIQVIVLKGAALAERLYPQIGLRPMSDIDLLVRQSDLSEAQRIMESLGFEGAGNQALQDLYLHHHHHLAPYLHQRTGAMVELHWQLVRPDHPYRLDAQEMWANAREVSLAGVKCLDLESADQLIHLCIHFFGDRLGMNYGALLQLCDIALYLRNYDNTINWEDFNSRVIRDSVSSEVYTTLYAARLVLGASYPEEVDIRLRPTDFDESIVKLFITHRVLGRGRELPQSIVQALASPHGMGKLRAFIRTLRSPEPWLPGGDENEIQHSSPLRSVLTYPSRALTAIGKLSSHLRQIRGQVVTQRWLTQFENSDSYTSRDKPSR